MTRVVYALATVLYAAARAVEWVARTIHRAALHLALAKQPTAHPGNRPGPRAVP